MRPGRTASVHLPLPKNLAKVSGPGMCRHQRLLCVLGVRERCTILSGFADAVVMDFIVGVPRACSLVREGFVDCREVSAHPRVDQGVQQMPSGTKFSRKNRPPPAVRVC